MSLTKEDVKTLADLARLQLSDDELKSAERELDAILTFVDRLQKIDTSHVEPQSMPDRAAGWREDVALDCDDVTREYILSNFPSRKGDLLSVPAVFEKNKGERG
jgi:aspartyl-tRNA(Asn)/glutamyl-tRNA(Gln) amidotransferase subunit C